MNSIVSCACGTKYNVPQASGPFACSQCGQVVAVPDPLSNANASQRLAPNPLYPSQYTPQQKRAGSNLALKLGIIIGTFSLLIVMVVVWLVTQLGNREEQTTADNNPSAKKNPAVNDKPTGENNSPEKDAFFPFAKPSASVNGEPDQFQAQGQTAILPLDVIINDPNLPLLPAAEDVDVTRGQWNIGYLRHQAQTKELYNSNRLIMISMQKCSSRDLAIFRDYLRDSTFRAAAATALLNWRQDVNRMVDIVADHMASRLRDPRFTQEQILSFDRFDVQIFDVYGSELKSKWVSYLDHQSPEFQLIGIYQLGRLGADAKDCEERLESFTKQTNPRGSRSVGARASTSRLQVAAQVAIHSIKNPETINRQRPPSIFARPESLRSKRNRVTGWQTYQSPCKTYSIDLPGTDTKIFSTVGGDWAEVLFDDAFFEVTVRTLDSEDQRKSWRATSIQLGDRLVEDNTISTPAQMGFMRKFRIDDIPQAECMHISQKNVYRFRWTGIRGGDFSNEIDKFFASFEFRSEFDAARNHKEFTMKYVEEELKRAPLRSRR